MKVSRICGQLLSTAVCRGRNLLHHRATMRLSAAFGTQENKKREKEPESAAGTFNLRPETCYYKILNIETGAKNADIKQAFQKLVKKYHPDVNPDPKAVEIYKKVTEAYDVLADPNKRKLYDESIGATDEFYTDEYSAANPNRRMWNYRHQQILEEEIRRSMENPAPWRGEKELIEYLESSAQAADEALIQAKKERDLALKAAKEAEPPFVVNGVKQDPEKMYEYFRSKYIKNPDIETRDPDEQLDFSWKLYNKTTKRVNDGRKNYYEFAAGSDKGSFFIEKQAEDNILSPAGSAFSHSAGFIAATVAVLGCLWFFLTASHQSASQDVVGSKKVMRGEGITQKVVPI